MQADLLSPSAEAAKEGLSSALLPASAQLSGRAAAAASRGARGQNGMWPLVFQRIEALEEWVRMQLAHQQRQHELKVEETFHDLQERLLALEGDRPKLELSIAQLDGSVKGIVEQLTSDAQHNQAADMRQREWRRALEEHVRAELSGAERVREARLQEFHGQLTELERELRARQSLEDAMRSELACSAIAGMESGALQLHPGTEHPARALLVAAAGTEFGERLDGLEWKLQNFASNAQAAAAGHRETLQWHAAKLSELQDLVQGLGGSHEQLGHLLARTESNNSDRAIEEIRRDVSSISARITSCEQVLDVDHEFLKLQKEVADTSARLSALEQVLQAASDEEEEAENRMSGIEAGNSRGLEDMGETFSIRESDVTSSQGDDN